MLSMKRVTQTINSECYSADKSPSSVSLLSSGLHEGPSDSAEPGPQPASTVSSKLWIVNPAIDLLFVCGGMLWILVAFAMANPVLFSSKTAPLFMILTQIGAIFFLDPHNAATVLRICNEKELRDKHRILWLWSPLVLGFFFVLSLLYPLVFLICLKVYLSLVPQHITAQSYGICLMYFSRAKILPNRSETVAIKVAFTLMAITSLLRNFSDKAVTELMGVKVPSLLLFPESAGQIMAACAWAATIFAFALISYRLLRNDKRRVPIAVLALAFSTLVLLTLGPVLGLAVVFSSSFFHASQYLIVSGSVHLKNTDRQSVKAGRLVDSIFRSASFWGQTIVLGLLIYLALPTGLAHFGIPVTKAAVAALCFASLHHFLADALIWRIRDPKTRTALST